MTPWHVALGPCPLLTTRHGSQLLPKPITGPVWLSPGRLRNPGATTIEPASLGRERVQLTTTTRRSPHDPTPTDIPFMIFRPHAGKARWPTYSDRVCIPVHFGGINGR